MGWRVASVDEEVRLAMWNGVLTVNDVAFTDGDGWINVPLTNDARESNANSDLRVRVFVRRESTGRFALFIDSVHFLGRTYSSLHSFAFQRGTGWVRYVPTMVSKCFETHAEAFARRGVMKFANGG